ncbi:MAG: metallophosphoesterase [Phycisphaerales bacterium]|nr:metallophosphoesterase [Phycisphaerales bacterium]
MTPDHPDFAYRRPVPPYPVETHELPLPSLPAALEGLRILHLSDLHVRRLRLRSGLIARTVAALPHAPVDLVLLTGDYADRPGHEHAALRTLRAFASSWRAPHGAVAVFGNHDTALMRRLARTVPGLRCIDAGAIDLPDLPLRILGASYPEDLFAAALERSVDDRFEVALVHDPVAAIAAAELRVPLVLAGHTHGGQVRVSARAIPHTSSDLPASLASGVLRIDGTTCCISRGLGDAMLPLRLNCPPHAPLYVLRRGDDAGPSVRAPCSVRPW